MLPISLAISCVPERRRPRSGDYLGVLGVLLGVIAFLVAVGQPGTGRRPSPGATGLTVILVLVIGAMFAAAAARRTRRARAATTGRWPVPTSVGLQ